MGTAVINDTSARGQLPFPFGSETKLVVGSRRKTTAANGRMPFVGVAVSAGGGVTRIGLQITRLEIIEDK